MASCAPHVGLLLFALLVGLVRLAVQRTSATHRLRVSTTRGAWVAATTTVALALMPALRDAPLLAGSTAHLAGDAASHLAVASEIARSGLPHGWLATYNGGFPMALHYQPLGWLMTAGLLRAGVPPVVAIRGLGLTAILVAPISFFIFASLRGSRPTSAAAGAICLAWVAPYIEFTGAWEPFLTRGLLAQVLVIPIVIVWGASVLRPARVEAGPALAALAALTHPQIFTAACLILAVTAVASWDRAGAARVARSILAGLLVAVAVYGPGIRSMTIPFGWPEDLVQWHVVGFSPDKVIRWLLEGDLLDYRHAPVVSTAWLVSLIVHALSLRSRASRCALVASMVALVCLCSPWLTRTGRFGELVLGVFQPMRALALTPVIAAATIATALDVAGGWLHAIGAHFGAPEPLRKWRLEVLVPAFLPVCSLVLAALALPGRFGELHEIAKRANEIDPSCARIQGFDPGVVERWLSTAPRGRGAFAPEYLGLCAGVYHAHANHVVPMSASRGAGIQVGGYLSAAARLDPSREGSAARAEALGIRTLVHQSSERPLPSERWEMLEAHGDVGLSRRVGGSDYVGLGCVREVLRGTESALRRELVARLKVDGRTFLDTPDTLVALETTRGPLERVAIEDACDASTATAREIDREPGAFEADIAATAPVDVVFRSTAYGGWRVHDGSAELSIRRVAPGFFAVRVPPGRHHLEAVVQLPRGYGATVMSSLVIAGVLALFGPEGRVGRRFARWRRLPRGRASARLSEGDG